MSRFIEEWYAVICTLNNWERNPSDLDEENGAPPSPKMCESARQLANRLASTGRASPKFLIPVDGEIVFEFHNGRECDFWMPAITEKYIVDDSGVEYIRLVNHVVTVREKT